MKKSFLLSANIVTLVLLLSACSGGSRTSSHSETPVDTVEFRYAENIRILKFKNYAKVELRNPWDTLKTLHTYILTDRNNAKSSNLPEGTIVRTPLENAIVYSSVHNSLIAEIGGIESIAGVCDIQYIKHPQIKAMYEKGVITDCGSSMSPDIEKIIDLNADAVLLSPFENSGGYGRIESIGVPIIECADYMETSPLGRAEWMKFYGLLTGREQEAESLFRSVENEYLSLKQIAKDVTNRPTVISELKYSSAWYVPGGKSTTAKIIDDAGADYIFSYTTESGSVPMSFETVLDKGQKADFWLIKYNQKQDKTYSELKKDYSPYTNFDAWKNKRIFGCNTSYVNFYEETPFHPEALLRDLIIIFHPEIMKDEKTRYFTGLKF
ncbi:ABC transporter substrate-binding protein [uncultured Bacteroides sp.]|uniref:ABC transporter substrate-binding protein n=1 Tax=uncultured Bacteroides sp. TaxID=162156 RepID=UPI0026143923|nr:ABC transporter substrate-binding protein [uncultured Bacteroides sp.]